MFQGKRIELKSSQLESKVLNGIIAAKGKHKYVASLQLNNYHVCRSTMIQLGFLLTTDYCACYIGNGIEMELKKATAVFMHLSLKEGQRIYISEVAYYSGYRNLESSWYAILKSLISRLISCLWRINMLKIIMNERIRKC